MSTPEVNITIFDTTLRDGAQSLPEKHQFPDGSKAEIADHIASLGVAVIEAGFPRTPSDAEEVNSVANSVGQRDYAVTEWVDGEPTRTVNRPVVIAGLSRVTIGDIEATWEAIQGAHRPRIHTFVSTSDFHREAKFPGISRDELLIMARKGVKYAYQISSAHTGSSIEFSAEAASTTDPKYLERVVKTALEEGADVINLPDTVGERSPFWMIDFYRKAIHWVKSTNPDATISAHNHNDLGNAVPNTQALIFAAATYAHENDVPINIQTESTMCGLGERAGNADIFPVVAGLFKFSKDGDYDAPVRWQFNPDRSVETARTVMGMAGLNVARQSPVVGVDTNVHRSGIHSDGVLKGGSSMYTPHDPMFWGHEQSAVHERGKYQGRAGMAATVRNQ